MELPDDASKEEKVFAANATGKCSFVAKKSDAASALESFLAEVRADGTPSVVMCVRSDNEGEFFGGEFGALCCKRGMWYGLPPLAGVVWPFLKPVIYRVNRENKSQPKAQEDS